MFLRSVIIENFRCLKKVELQLNKTTVFIGENNSGKTACLEAIKTVLGRTSANATFEEYDYYTEGKGCDPKASDGISIKFVFAEMEANEWNGDVRGRFASVIRQTHDEALAADLCQLTLCVTSKYDHDTARFEVEYNFLDENGEKIALKNRSLITELLKHNPVFYLQAWRESVDVFSRRSFTWGKLPKQISIAPEDLQEIQKSISYIDDGIADKDELLRSLFSSMYDIEKALGVNTEEGGSVEGASVRAWDSLSKVKLPLEKFSQGTQSMSMILLYEIYVNILLKQVYHKDAEAIFSIEEPEGHLHPQAIRALEKQLRHIGSQKIITTHSPYFLQNVDIFDIRLFRKRGGVTTICSIPRNVSMPIGFMDETLEKITHAYRKYVTMSNGVLIALKGIPEVLENCLTSYLKRKSPGALRYIPDFVKASKDLFSEEEINQLNTFVKQNRGELFFAKSWLMAEGQSETVILPYFAKVMGYDLDEYGVSLIDYRSNGSAKAFIKLARVLGYEWSLLADNDAQGTRTFSEIRKSGYSNEDIDLRARKTIGRDIEKDLVDGFLSDYEAVLGWEITADIARLKSVDQDAYKEKIIDLVQNNKVENSYKLVSILEARKMSQEEIPENIRYLIERLCKK